MLKPTLRPYLFSCHVHSQHYRMIELGMIHYFRCLQKSRMPLAGLVYLILSSVCVGESQGEESHWQGANNPKFKV